MNVEGRADCGYAGTARHISEHKLLHQVVAIDALGETIGDVMQDRGVLVEPLGKACVLFGSRHERGQYEMQPDRTSYTKMVVDHTVDAAAVKRGLI